MNAPVALRYFPIMRRVVPILLAAAAACAQTQEPADAGPTLPADSGLSEPADSGTNGPVDSGAPDAGSADAGASVEDSGMDAGSQFLLSCTGIADCATQMASISVAGARECEGMGTSSGRALFAPLLDCTGACASEPDAGGCINALVADGGTCSALWDACQSDGVACGEIIACVEAHGTSSVNACEGEGTHRALQLFQALVACIASECASQPAAGGCESSGITPPQCLTDAFACSGDTSGSPDAGTGG